MGLGLQHIFEQWKESNEIQENISAKMYDVSNKDPVAFIESQYGWYDPDTQAPIVLQGWERYLLWKIFNSDKPRRVIADIKKNLKTCKGAIVLYVNAWMRPNCTQYIVGNDQKQSENRAFQYIKNVVGENNQGRRTPGLNPYCKDVQIKRDVLIFPNGSRIWAVAQDPKGESGSDAFCVLFDECWAMTKNKSQRLLDEFTIPATQKGAYHLFSSYAGHDDDLTEDGEYPFWRNMYLEVFDEDGALREDRAKCIDPGDQHWSNDDYETTEFPLYETKTMLMYWSHGPLNGHPGHGGHTEKYFEDQKDIMLTRPFLRLLENRWVSKTQESVFEKPWILATKQSIVKEPKTERFMPYAVPPLEMMPEMPLYVGVDASSKHDHSAVASVYQHPDIPDKLCVGPWRVWKPDAKKKTVVNLPEVEEYIHTLNRYCFVHKIVYDPSQLHKMMTDMSLTIGKHRVVELPQSAPNLIRASENLMSLIKGFKLLIPDDPDENLLWYVRNAAAHETQQGWMIKKFQGRFRSKIDWLVAFSFACLYAVKHMREQESEESPADQVRREAMEREERRFAASVGSDQTGQSIYGGTDDFGGLGWDDILSGFEKDAYGGGFEHPY